MTGRDALKRKRQRAIQILRDTGMSDADIEAELGFSISDDEPLEIVDAEIVEETPNLPVLVEKPWSRERMEDRERLNGPYQARPGRDETNRSTIPENVAAYNSSLENNRERRCVATNSKGERCRKFAIAGSTVCKTHGGSARHVVNKARVRVEMASNRLMGKLIEVAFDDTKPAAVQLDAIKDSLNRAGLKPREQVEVGPITPFEDVFSDIVAGPPIDVETSEPQQNSSGACSAEPPPDQPPPADPSGHGTQATAGYDYYPPFAPQADEPRPPKPSHRRAWQDRVNGLSDDDAIRLANEENAMTLADPPPPRPMRALPPGRGW